MQDDDQCAGEDPALESSAPEKAMARPRRGLGKGRPTKEEFYSNPTRASQGVTAQRLAGLGLQDEDIAVYVGIKVEKLTSWFKKELQMGRVQRKILIAKGQMKLVSDGDREMLKMLGEECLGQGGQRHVLTPGGNQYFQINVGNRPAQLDGPPPPPVRKLVSCGASSSVDALCEPEMNGSPQTSASSLMRRARAIIGGDPGGE